MALPGWLCSRPLAARHRQCLPAQPARACTSAQPIVNYSVKLTVTQDGRESARLSLVRSLSTFWTCFTLERTFGMFLSCKLLWTAMLRLWDCKACFCLYHTDSLGDSDLSKVCDAYCCCFSLYLGPFMTIGILQAVKSCKRTEAYHCTVQNCAVCSMCKCLLILSKIRQCIVN